MNIRKIAQSYLIICNLILLFSLLLTSCRPKTEVPLTPELQYREIQKKLKSGWGTFNNRNILSHVLLPEGMALNIGIKSHEMGADDYLRETIISSRGLSRAVVRPGYKSYDGSYSELEINWNSLTFRIESATTMDNDLVLLITPVRNHDSIPSVILGTGFLWNRPGSSELVANTVVMKTGTKSLTVHTNGTIVKEYLPDNSPYLAAKLDKPVAFYTGKTISDDQIMQIISQRRAEQDKIYSHYGSYAAVYQALQSAIGWNIIYDASHDRVIFPVSRIWTETFGAQYVLFDWDTYFGAWMAGLGSKELAYANAVEITKSITPGGFIPNFSGSYGSGSYDRSQPPVGSRVILELYNRFKDKWLLEYVWDNLLTWNRWWPKNRDHNGLLCWGSSPVAAPLRSDFATDTWQGAAYESGLDNSPMFDAVPFSKNTHLMEQADAGLMGLYVMDCDALAEIAMILGKTNEAGELHERADYYRNNLSLLWDDKSGIFKNKRTDINIFSSRLSPTNFYPLLAKAATQEQATRMMKEHFMNPEEFYGEWMIPSISRNDTAFKSQDYWRGRIWGPMNFLTYLGLRNYDLPEARATLATKSSSLIMENVSLNGYVYENYNAVTGNLKNLDEARLRGDTYYDWGALLGFIQLMEAGFWDEKR